MRKWIWEIPLWSSREGNGTPLQYSCLENPMDGGAWWAAVHGVPKSWARLSDFNFTFCFHALKKEMATHSSVLAWRIPGTGEPGGLPSMGLHRVRHYWSDLAAASSCHSIICWKDSLLFHWMPWYLCRKSTDHQHEALFLFYSVSLIYITLSWWLWLYSKYWNQVVQVIQYSSFSKCFCYCRSFDFSHAF